MLALVVLSLSLLLGVPQEQKGRGTNVFRYDPARTLEPELLPFGDEAYAPGLARLGGDTWLTWLRYVPGQGDELWIASRPGSPGRASSAEPNDATAWPFRKRLLGPGSYARPTWTSTPGGTLWLTYEAFDEASDSFHVYARRRLAGGDLTPPFLVSERPEAGNATNLRHRCVAGGEDELYVVWQADHGGQFDVFLRRLEAIDGGSGAEAATTAATAPPVLLSTSTRGDWHPSLARTPRGALCVAWDTLGPSGFDVVARWRAPSDGPLGEGWGPARTVASSPRFEGRAQLAAAGAGSSDQAREGVWILWEEGGTAWGAPFVASGIQTPVLDARGPLHRSRRLRFGYLEPNGTADDPASGLGLRLPERGLPLPGFRGARSPRDQREGAKELGIVYERGELAVDGQGRPWVLYRHSSYPRIQRDVEVISHTERGSALYARCLGANGWSAPQRVPYLQRDGLQRASVAPTATGLQVIWHTGRRDRRANAGGPLGLALVSFEDPSRDGAPRRAAFAAADDLPPAPAEGGRPVRPAPLQAPGLETMQLAFGDLHRHTDFSLCLPFFDGSLDDAYRYAIEVASLDFLGITDHIRDFQAGDPQSQLWWRNRKAVLQHRLRQRFFPFFAAERSDVRTDHNVFSLDGDIPFDYQRPPRPLTTFWERLDPNTTFTVPHAPFYDDLWNHHDDRLRPAMEVHQGFRHAEDHLHHAHEGLRRGHHFGFLASSDHLSTQASFACVWTASLEREEIFRAIQARSVYAATDRIRLVVRSGEHLMGSRLRLEQGPLPLVVEVDGTAALERVEVIVDGEPLLELPLEGGTRLRTAGLQVPLPRRTGSQAPPPETASGEHFVYVRVLQADGNRAWSSPLWVRRGP